MAENKKAVERIRVVSDSKASLPKPSSTVNPQPRQIVAENCRRTSPMAPGPKKPSGLK